MGNSKRWSVTYTKHVKQKRKVYQDGYLELQDSGNKIMLYDEYDRLLETRFVKKDDVIKSSESMTFDSYLVDIGEQCGGIKPFSSSNCRDNDKKVKEKLSSSCNHGYKNNSDRKPSFGKSTPLIKLSPSQKIIREFKKSELNKYKSSSSPSSLDMKKSIKIGQPQYSTSQREHSDFGGSSCKVVNTNISCRTPINVPKRAAHEILSILRKPMIQEKLVSKNKLLLEEHHDSHSSVHYDIKHHINICAQNCNGSAVVKVIEEFVDDDCSTKILKCEDVEILNDSENCPVSENARRSQARSSTFCVSSGTINRTSPTRNVEDTDNSELKSISLTAEPQILVTPTLDSFGQTPSTPASLMKANKNMKLENPPQIISCKENGTKITAASTNDLSFNILPKFCEENNGTSSIDHEGVHSFGIAESNNGASQDPSDAESKALMYNFNTKEIAEFPSFDLGF